MITMLIGKALSPFAAVILVWAVAAPIRRCVERFVPECRAKRLLLSRIN